MLGKNAKSINIRLHILSQLKDGSHEFVRATAEQFNISVQGVHRHINWLEAHGYIISEGKTKAKVYSLGRNREQLKFYQLKDLDENEAYLNDFSHVFEAVGDSIDEICHYGFTEMLNNAIDHSEGDRLSVLAHFIDGQLEIHINDDGEGIFRRIARLLKLENQNESLLELSKGKLTTDPSRHSGEGIFFTSRVFDSFAIISGDLIFTHFDDSPDLLDEVDRDREGTTILMNISAESTKNLGKVFDEFSSGPDDYSFEKTVIPVRLAKFEGEKLVSRSQAKRLMRSVEKFRRVVLDFEGIGFIGQSFADEVFRVYANNHPEIKISVRNLNENGIKMMKRALAHKRN